MFPFIRGRTEGWGEKEEFHKAFNYMLKVGGFGSQYQKRF